jgi:hypothetical protein
MLIKDWNFIDEVVRSVDDDVFYCDTLNRMVDLGWDEYISMVHDWIRVLNIINGELYKNGIIVEVIQMNSKTFNLIQLDNNEYYKDKKLGSYLIEVSEDLKNNIIQLISNKNIVGKILIKSKQK